MSAVLTIAGRPTVDDLVREDAIEILTELLEKAKDGQVGQLVCMYKAPNGKWSYQCARSLNIAEAIGRMELTKALWIRDYETSDPS